MEKYIGWIIDERNVTSGFFRSDVAVDLEADIYPDWEALYNFLKDNGIVQNDYEQLIRIVRASLYGYSPNPSYSESQDLSFINAIIQYSEKNHYATRKTAKAILSITQTGSSRTRERAMKKIKEWVRDSLPNPRQGIIQFLKERRMIAQSVNPFCEILSKDL